MRKAYIFDKETVAHAFAMTARYLGYEVTQIGSAVIAKPAEYEDVLDKTMAIPAALVTIQEAE